MKVFLFGKEIFSKLPYIQHFGDAFVPFVKTSSQVSYNREKNEYQKGLLPFLQIFPTINSYLHCSHFLEQKKKHF